MSELRVNSVLDASGGNTATVNGIPLRQGVLDPENRIINGAFDFWQRGTSQTAIGYGSADRWLNNTSGGTVTMSRQTFTLGDTLGSNSPTFFLRHSVSGQTLAASFAVVQQRIEGVRSYAGQTITVLGWARRSSGSGNMAVEGFQSFGTGGSPSANVNAINPTTITLTSSWTAFAATLTVPSVSGKTLGTDNNDFFMVNFWTSAGSDLNARTNSLGLQTIGVDLWGIHIKLGTHTTAAAALYKAPELQPELARCQRYYEKSYDLTTNPGTATTVGAVESYFPIAAANGNIMPIPFVVQKRSAPTVTLYSTSGAVNNIRDVGSALDRTAAVRSANPRAAYVTSSAATANNIHNAQFTADAEI